MHFISQEAKLFIQKKWGGENVRRMKSIWDDDLRGSVESENQKNIQCSDESRRDDQKHLEPCSYNIYDVETGAIVNLQNKADGEHGHKMKQNLSESSHHSSAAASFASSVHSQDSNAENQPLLAERDFNLGGLLLNTYASAPILSQRQFNAFDSVIAPPSYGQSQRISMANVKEPRGRHNFSRRRSPRATTPIQDCYQVGFHSF